MKLSELIYYLQRIYNKEGEKEVYVSDSGGYYNGLTIVEDEKTIYLEGYVKEDYMDDEDMEVEE